MKPDKPHSEKLGIQATRAEFSLIINWLSSRQRTMVLLAEAKRMMELDAASREEQAEVELESERQRTQEAAPWGVGPNFCMVCGDSIGANMTMCLRCAALEEAEAQRTQELDAASKRAISTDDRRCPTCSAALAADAVVCMRCGTVIDGEWRVLDA